MKKDKSPEFVLKDRRTGRIFGVNPHHESDPNFVKIPFAEAFPELCMPAHVEKRVKKTTNKKKATPKPKLDLVTEDVPADPEEILGSDIDDQIAEVLGKDASRGLGE